MSTRAHRETASGFKGPGREGGWKYQRPLGGLYLTPRSSPNLREGRPSLATDIGRGPVKGGKGLRAYFPSAHPVPQRQSQRPLTLSPTRKAKTSLFYWASFPSSPRTLQSGCSLYWALGSSSGFHSKRILGCSLLPTSRPSQRPGHRTLSLTLLDHWPLPGQWPPSLNHMVSCQLHFQMVTPQLTLAQPLCPL